LFVGVPFSFDEDLRFHSTITLPSLLNPFALLAGAVSLSMIVLHGAAWLNLKTTGAVKERAARVMPYAALAYVLLFAGAGFWPAALPGMHITSVVDPNGPSNPLLKTVAVVPGGWLSHMTSLPLLGLAAALLAAILGKRRPMWAFAASVLVQAGTIASAGVVL